MKRSMIDINEGGWRRTGEGAPRQMFALGCQISLLRHCSNPTFHSYLVI